MEEEIREGMEAIGLVIEVVGVLIVVGGAAIAMAPYLAKLVRARAGDRDFALARENLGRSILLGLEFLIAADLIDTVALEPTFESIAVLGFIVLVRTFLSISLETEIEGHWPWQRATTERARERAI
ncbi:MAG: DUF1622 domain-containing protein [Actinomycetota bacterium]|nr:DUF1622 domain-containing protein [Actinomycetota bacterium]